MSDSIVKECTVIGIFSEFIMVMWDEDKEPMSGMVPRTNDTFIEGDMAMITLNKNKIGKLEAIKIFKKRDNYVHKNDNQKEE